MSYTPTFQWIDNATAPNPLFEAGSTIVVNGFSNPNTLIAIVLVGFIFLFLIVWAKAFRR